MTTGDDLLAAVWAAPHDDLPRLAYADWLDERGDAPRAEFIRVQCAVAKLDPWDDGRGPLEKREAALRRKWGQGWKAGLPDAYRRTAGFHRGFPAPQLERMAATTFLGLPADILDAAPLWHVNLRPPAPTKLARVLASPLLRRVGSLKVDGWLPDAAAGRAFADCPHLVNLRRLEADATPDAAAAALAAGGGLPALTDLQLGYGDYGDAALAAVADGFSGRLRVLNAVGGRTITAAGIAVLLASPHPVALEWFRFPRWLNAAAMRVLAASRPAFRLRELVLTEVEAAEADGLVALAGWPGLGSLRHLVIGTAEWLPEEALARLYRSPHLAGLKALTLNFYAYGHVHPAADLLADPAVLPGLRRLTAQGLTDQSLADRLRARFGAGFRCMLDG